MIKGLNLQYLISYLGFIPFIFIIFDIFFLDQFEIFIIRNFVIYYSILIFVFIGSTNWNLKENISNSLVLYGFAPSISSVAMILLHLHSYSVFNLLIFLFLTQLFLDYFLVYKNNIEKKIYYILRLPLTFLIVISLFTIQL